MSYEKQFEWAADPQRQEKIINARLDAEFNAIELASSALDITIVSETTGSVAVGPLNYNKISVNDQISVPTGLDETGIFQTGYASAFNVRMTTGGSNITGFKIGSYVRLDHTVGNSDIVYADFIGSVSIAYSNKEASGHGLYAAESLVYADNGSEHDHVVGQNANLALDPGADVAYGVAVRAQRSGTGRATLTDAAYTIMVPTGNDGFSTGILLNEYNGSQSITTTGNFLESHSAITIANVLKCNNFTVTGNILQFPSATLTGAGSLTLGASGGAAGKVILTGNTSGAITVQPQAAAGTYNWNLPTSAGAAGDLLVSGGGGSTAMTWRTAIYGTFYLGTNQSYTATSVTKVNIDTAETSQGLTFDGATNHRVTIITAGRYWIACSVYISGLTTGGDLITGRVKKNGTTDVIISLVPATTNPAKEGVAVNSKVVNLAANDYLELYGSAQTNGTIGGLATVTFMSLHYIGP